MPGYHVHCFMTPAVYEAKSGSIYPAGRVSGFTFFNGMLLFMSDRSHQMDQYEVYHSYANIAFGPFSQSYAPLGKLGTVYPPGKLPELSQAQKAMSIREIKLDPRMHAIRTVCGYGAPIHQIWAFKTHGGGLDVYVQTIGQAPADCFSHYHVNITEPEDWWRAKEYTYIGMIQNKAWAPVVPPAAL